MAVTGGIIVAAGALGGAGVSSYFGNKSASAARKAAARAAEEMRQSKARAIGYQQPYYQSGTLGLNNLTGLLTGQQVEAGGGTRTLTPEERMGLFQTSPGYQFRLDQATKALQASQAARGGLLSGGAAKELTQYSQGIASDEYGNYINNLFGLAGMGQQAATNMGNYEIGAGSQIAGYDQAAGLTDAARYANQGNALGGIFNAASGIGGSMIGAGLLKNSLTPTPAGTTSGASSGGVFNSSAFQAAQTPNYGLR